MNESNAIRLETDSEHAACYVPPVVSNGELSLAIDFLGSQQQKEWLPGSQVPKPRIWFAGRRFDRRIADLVPQGHIEHTLKANGRSVGEPRSWKQSIEHESGAVCSTVNYDLLTLSTRTFVASDCDVILLELQFDSCIDCAVNIDFEQKYFFDDLTGKHEISKYIADGKACFSYTVDAISHKSAKVMLSEQNGNAELAVSDDFMSAAIRFTLGPDDVQFATFILQFEDDISRNAPKCFSPKEAFNNTRKDWNEYWQEGFVSLPEDDLQKTYYASLYHLKCTSTRWSIPTGLFDTHWHGRYFAYDEFFSVNALLSSGHMQMARKVPQFRRDGLDRAVFMATSSRQRNDGILMAQYPWQSTEIGEEGGSAGFWRSHIFHIANIALECWQAYRFLPQKEYLLETAYPVIRACAEYFSRSCIYETPEGKLIIGSCTDFERLGASVRNPFATTCGAIATLRAAVKASELLECDAESRALWNSQATRLKACLPNNGERYIPYPDCTEMNIGILAGIFPYAATGTDDKLAFNAFKTFSEQRNAAGNMYHCGKGLCSWYAGWLCTNAARYRQTNVAYSAIKAAAKNTGAFSELFEILEPERDIFYRPWFSTGEAMYIQGINEMLLQSDENSIDLFPAIPPSWKNVCFKLPAIGGITVKAKLRDGLLDLIEYYRNIGRPSPHKITFRGETLSDSLPI